MNRRTAWFDRYVKNLQSHRCKIKSKRMKVRYGNLMSILIKSFSRFVLFSYGWFLFSFLFMAREFRFWATYTKWERNERPDINKYCWVSGDLLLTARLRKGFPQSKDFLLTSRDGKSDITRAMRYSTFGKKIFSVLFCTRSRSSTRHRRRSE